MGGLECMARGSVAAGRASGGATWAKPVLQQATGANTRPKATSASKPGLKSPSMQHAAVQLTAQLSQDFSTAVELLPCCPAALLLPHSPQRRPA